MNKETNGYEERAHPADLAMFVWAVSLSELFVQAGKGMGELLKPEVSEDEVLYQTRILCEAADIESLLVAFLSEILYCLDEKQILFIPSKVRIEQNRLTASLEGRQVTRSGREIKAVTYSNLQIRKTRSGFETTIVFDI